MPETGNIGTTAGEAALPASRKQEAVPGLALGLALLSAGPVVILVLLIVVLSFLSPYFLTGRNLSNILAQTAVISVVAMGQHLVILTRGIDLSVGSNVALASVVGALSFHAGAPAIVVIAVMVGCGAAVGAINGLFYVFGRLPHPLSSRWRH